MLESNDLKQVVNYSVQHHNLEKEKKSALQKFFDKHGIVPEKADPSHSVNSIGYSEREKKFYGWSHRAIFGFGIGYTTKLGDCSYEPANKEEFLKELESWYSDKMYKNVKLTPVSSGVRISYEIHPKSGGSKLSYSNIDPYPKKWGRGEWTARTLADCKEMAKSFAESVS